MFFLSDLKKKTHESILIKFRFVETLSLLSRKLTAIFRITFHQLKNQFNAKI